MGRKMNFFLSVLLVLLFGMGLSTCCLAIEPDYTDFDIPIEFWESLINYYNLNVNTYKNGNWPTVFPNSAENLKFYYDNTFKSVLKNYADSNGYTDQNFIILFFSTSISSLNLIFVPNNNSIGNVAPIYSYSTINGNQGINIETSNNLLRITVENNSFSNSNINPSDLIIWWYVKTGNIDTSTSTYNDGPWFGLNQKPLNIIRLKQTQFSNDYYNYFINGYYNINPVSEEPDEPSGDEGGGTTGGTTGTITNPSGDTTGKVDLSGIESGIGDINQNIDKTNEKLDGISGEIGKLNENLTTVPDVSNTTITSGEITDALDFQFAEDPYANFWLELTTGLSGALTNNIRSIDVQFRNKTYKIELDNFTIQMPQILKTFLTLTSTVFIFWKMIKYWKIIIDNITSGNMDEVLEMNEEEGITDLF